MAETKHSLAGIRMMERSRYLRRVDPNPGKGGRRWPLLVCLTLLVMFGRGNAAAADLDTAAVQRSIDRGIAYLRKTQTDRGGWEEYPGQSCGLSALCTLALLNSGVGRDDPDMIDAMGYLRSFEPNETYSVALQTLVYCQLGAARDLPGIHRNVKWLVNHQKKAGTAANRIGSWDYGRNSGSGDPSNAQFALLALGAAVDRGIEVDPEVFRLSLDYWTKGQQREGGWVYFRGRRASGSMTCAGIASVIIARGRLGDGSSQIAGDSIQCCGGQDAAEDPVERGLDWLARNFSLQVNPGGDSFTFFYYMYALERVGRLSGRRFIGDHDWYREGAERLVALQDDFLGFWSGAGSLENRDIATSFALLFLSKGKRQVVIGRLKYPDPQAQGLQAAGLQAAGRQAARPQAARPQSRGQWQLHPDALRQLVRHVERDWRRDLTWQTIGVTGARLEDLLQSPVLVISGQRELQFTSQVSDRLKQYVDNGGCILFEADAGDGCGNAAGFENSVRRLTESWFEGSALERLPPDHPIWFAEHRVDPAVLGDDFWVYGVQACCRTAVFYVPRSLSCRWELGDALFHRDRGSKAARTQIDGAIRIGQNLIAYATGRELKDKLDQHLVLDGSLLPEASRDSIQMAMLAIDAGGQEARRALPNAAALIAAGLPVKISAAPRAVGFDADQLRDVPFLWIHGRTDFTLDDSQRSVLREFVESGGIILGSAVCGAPEFADAFRRELARTLPDSPLEAVPPNHPSLTAYGGFDVRQVTIRSPASGGKGVGRRLSPPQLEMAVVDDVVAVFFSPLDLSCALESPNSVQCPGYGTEDAAKIVANLVLFGLHQ